MSEPNHPFLLNTLINIINLIRADKLKQPIFSNSLQNSKKFIKMICVTGPMVFTASVLQTISQSMNTTRYRYVGIDFEIYLGMYRGQGYKPKSNYYINMMDKRGIPLLARNDSANSGYPLTTYQKIISFFNYLFWGDID